MKTFYKTCKELIIISLCLLFQTKFLSAQVQTAKPNTVVNANCHGFYEYLPQGYASGSATYPVIIFFHGSGELGNGSASSLPAVLRNGPPKLISQGQFPASFTVNGQSFKFIVISPQFNVWPTQQDVLDMVNYTLSHYRVDRSRVYLTGLSMGAVAVGDFASSTSTPTNTQMLAAIVTVSGSTSPIIQKATQMVKYLLPVWALHNQGDPTAPVQSTIDFINLLNTARNTAISKNIPVGPAPKLTIFPVSGHDAWSKAYDPNYKENNLNVYEWMLSYSRGGSTPPNAPPTVNAGADKSISLPTSSVALSASASDASGSIKTYAWSKISGPSQFSISNAGISNPIISNLVAGTYIFRLTVTDNLGATASDSINIVVNGAINKAPVANAGADKSITLPANSIVLSGTGTDADGTIIKYAWTKISGPASFTFSNAAISNPTVSNLTAGTYTFRLTVTDNLGTSTGDDINIIVNSAANKVPVANAGADKSITLPANSIVLSGTGTDADGTIIKYAWTKISGPASFTFSNAAINNPTVSNLAAGTYTFRLTVTDNLGTSAADDINITVNGAPPATGGGGGVIKVNIYSGSNPYNDTQWNNWAISTSGATNISSAALKYSNGSTSSVKANLSQSTGVADNGSAYSASGTGMAPNEVLRYSSFSTVTRTLTFSGLTASMHYSLELYASRKSTAGNGTNFKIGSQSKTVATDNNFTVTASFTDLVADAQGELTVSLNRTTAYTYINGFALTEGNSSGETTIPAVNSDGTKYLKVDLFSGSDSYNDNQWYNWNIGAGGRTNISTPALRYSDGSTSTVTANLSQSTGVSDNGVGYPASGTVMAPAEVLRHCSYSTMIRTLTLNGLSVSGKYDIELYASRNANSGNSTVFTINDLSTTVSSYKNFTSKATFTGLRPDGQGRITIIISRGSTYNYLNGFIITEGSTAAAPSVNVSSPAVSFQATAEGAVLNKEDGNLSNFMKASPNPVHDNFILEVANNNLGNLQVQVIGITGAVQKTFTIVKDQVHITKSISVSNLPAGTYFVRVQIKEWSGVLKIIKL